MGREVGGKFKREGTYIHLWVIHVDVWYKTTKFCRATILQFKNKLRKSLRFTISTLGMFCFFFKTFKFCQIRSVAQSCLTFCEPMNCSTPGLPVHHQLLEFTETHVHRVSDAIQPSHPLLSPSPPAPN